ncbi:MAG: carboxymuconolactone decarboxylase family protein [Microbacteriaceae bacterium]
MSESSEHHQNVSPNPRPPRVQHPSRAYAKVYKEQAPDVLKAWRDFDAAVFSAEREIPQKYLQLMALAVTFTTQCEFCIEGHTVDAIKAGASDTEITEAAWVAAALRAGGAYAHGRIAFMAADQHRHPAG